MYLIAGLIFILVAILLILYVTGVFNSTETTPTTGTTEPLVAKCYQGDVTIDWGHTAGDAGWACNNWKSTCGNNEGCTATGPGTVVDGKSTWACNLKTNCSP